MLQEELAGMQGEWDCAYATAVLGTFAGEQSAGVGGGGERRRTSRDCT